MLISWGVAGQELAPIENYSTQLGLKQTTLKDTYLSPLAYKGFGITLNTEKINFWLKDNTNFLRQKRLSVSLITTHNPAKTSNEFGSSFKYSYGLLKKLYNNEVQRLYLGANLSGDLDLLYHTQNSNNPFNMHLGANLGASILLLRSFKIFKFPIRLRLQMDTPLLGVFFMPEYGHSYYEMFSLNNKGNATHFASLHNQQRLHSTCSFDFDLWNCTMRISWYNDLFRQQANSLKYNYVNNAFTIGFVRELIPVKSKKVNINNSSYSPFY